MCVQFYNSVMLWARSDQGLSTLIIQRTQIAGSSLLILCFFRREGTVGEPSPRKIELPSGSSESSVLF